MSNQRDKVVFKLEGDAELKSMLKDLPPSVMRKALRAGITQQGRKAAKSAKAKARKMTGQLRKSIGFKVRTYPKTSTVYAVIGPRKGFAVKAGEKLTKKTVATKNIDPLNYAHLVEFETKHSQSHPFLKSSFDEVAPQSPPIIFAKVKEVIAREAVKQAAKVRAK